MKKLLWNLGIVLKSDCIKAVQKLMALNMESVQRYAKEDFKVEPDPKATKNTPIWAKKNFKTIYLGIHDTNFHLEEKEQP